MLKGCRRAVVLSASLLLMAGCSGTRDEAGSGMRDKASAPRPYQLPAELTVDMRAERGPEGEIHIVGSTNLPDRFKLWVHVESGRLPSGGPKVIGADDGVFVSNSGFKTAGLWSQSASPYFTAEMRTFPDAANLKYRKRPFAAGGYRVRLIGYFNGSWQKPDVLTALGGYGGKKLHGKILKLTDPDVNDSDQIIDDLETVAFPSLSPEVRAISAVKGAVLTVQGRGRSVTDVETVIKLMFDGRELRPAKGWTAKRTGSDSYEVVYDFINGKDGPDQAVWSMSLKTGEVRYLNTNAKIFSWSPGY